MTFTYVTQWSRELQWTIKQRSRSFILLLIDFSHTTSYRLLLICISAASRSGRQDKVDRSFWDCHLTIQNLIHMKAIAVELYVFLPEIPVVIVGVRK